VNEAARVRGRTLLVARGLVVVISLAPTLVYLFVALRRIGYPYELEWLEGGAVEIAGRVAHGQAIYVAPSIHYVPYPYTPLYFWITGTLARFIGVGFLPLRLVSLLSSLGACAMLVRIVWRETGDVVAGVLASGLYTATFAVSGAWFDIGRVDSLALFLLLAALYVARRADGISGGLAVGALVFVAFLAKQSDLIAAAPVVLWLVFTRRRTGVTALVTSAVLVVGSTFILNALTHDWYGYYVFQELFHQGVIHAVWRTFFTQDLWHTPWAIGLGAAGLAVSLRNRRASSIDLLYWASAIVGLLASSLVSRLHSGGGADVLMPAFAATALFGAFGYDALLHFAAQPRRKGSVEAARPGRGSWVTGAAGALLSVVAAVQIGALHYSASRFIPKASDAAAGRAFIDQVRHTRGTVIVVNHPYYDTLAGKASFAQGEAMHDIMRSGPSLARRVLLRSVDAFLRSSQPATVYSDYPNFALGGFSDPYFSLTPTKVFRCTNCFYPVTDLKLRPAYRFVRRSPPSAFFELDEPAARVFPQISEVEAAAGSHGGGVGRAQGGPLEHVDLAGLGLNAQGERFGGFVGSTRLDEHAPTRREEVAHPAQEHAGITADADAAVKDQCAAPP
jgi:dolichyl-phosphate-mannose-protein mannosyltransferase